MKQPSKRKFWITTLTLLIFILVFDQYTKYLIDVHLPITEKRIVHNGREYTYFHYLKRKEIEIVPNFMYVVHVVNKGAAWGIFQGRTYLLSIISIVAFVGMLAFFDKIVEGFYERTFALGLLMGGTLGNLVDRMNLIKRNSGIHGVVDFISLQYKPKGWEYPSFNVADSAICVGVFILIVSTFLRPDKNGEKTAIADAIAKRWKTSRNKKETPSINEAP